MTTVRPSFAPAAASEVGLAAFARLGYARQPALSVRAPEGDTTLFVSGGIQNWREWVTDHGRAGEARAGAQWCVRTNRLADVGSSSVLTSFCMLSAVRLGWVDRAEVLSHVLSVLDAWGIRAGRLAFIVTTGSADRPGDQRTVEALRTLGIAANRVAGRPRRWAQPFRPNGVTGPNLFVLLDRGTPCSAGCSPLCRCGRFLHFFNCEFLDYLPSLDGGIVPAPLPVTDLAGSLEWLGCASTGAGQVHDVEPLVGARTAVAGLLTGPQLAAVDLSVLVDHGRTVALLLADGVRPGPRAHGHIVRRLVRRMLTVLVSAGQEPTLLGALVLAAARSSAGLQGYPEPAVIQQTTGVLEAEVAAFTALLARGRRRYLNLLEGNPVEAAEAVFRVKTDHGVPLSILLGWCTADGIEVELDRLDVLLSRERDESHAGTGTRGWKEPS